MGSCSADGGINQSVVTTANLSGTMPRASDSDQHTELPRIVADSLRGRTKMQARHGGQEPAASGWIPQVFTWKFLLEPVITASYEDLGRNGQWIRPRFLSAAPHPRMGLEESEKAPRLIEGQISWNTTQFQELPDRPRFLVGLADHFPSFGSEPLRITRKGVGQLLVYGCVYTSAKLHLHINHVFYINYPHISMCKKYMCVYTYIHIYIYMYRHI